MNKDDKTNPTPPALPTSSPSEQDREDSMELHPLGKPANLGNTIDALLKTPGRLFYEMQEGEARHVALNLALIATGSLILFGFMMGLFSRGPQLWAVPLKVAGGGIVAAVITLPSLYVFSCLNGMDMTLQKASSILLAGMALVGLVLSGLCPVAWIFTQSTESIGFMGFLILAFWIIAIGFGVSLIFKSAKASDITRSGYLVVWVTIFITVTLQMSTSLRPLVGPAEATLLPTEKKFFVEHWLDHLTGDVAYRRSDSDR